MLAAILICGVMTILTSCSANDDNEITPIPSEEEYKNEGMTMPENAFLKIPAVAGDQNVINALKSIDKVTDVKAYNLVVGTCCRHCSVITIVKCRMWHSRIGWT